MDLLVLPGTLDRTRPVETVTVTVEVQLAARAASDLLKRRARERRVPKAVAEKVVVVEPGGRVVYACGRATERETVVAVFAELEVADFVRKGGVE